MATVLRNSGIPFIDQVSWGSHLCAFYETPHDLLETVAGYFAAGFAMNEMCVWAMPDEVHSDRAESRLRDMIPHFDEHVGRGRLRFVTAADRYMVEGRFDADAFDAFWVALLDQALARGHDGMRISGEALWLAKQPRADAPTSERCVERLLAGRPMIVLSTYHLAASRAADLLDAVRAHHPVVARRDGDWQPVDASNMPRNGLAVRDLGAAITRMQSQIQGSDQLTDRERKVFALLINGASSKEVARDLGISPRTVDFHRGNIIEKLGARNTADAIRRVLSRRRGLH
ncbi:MAG TPA: MEDS domain-containing protein [Pseudolabrys sp.]|uniref:MEDS domain-containing protein n=1 Tax=Pseudolabrys sp. TaxID=1960880 RepID=UPI002DDCFAE8|nr:MEDS domain-containing protein [Pseudolabrys sp.]HEV2627424.1 MEDS domain-containing protein [Pseudolabrys sp.]